MPTLRLIAAVLAMLLTSQCKHRQQNALTKEVDEKDNPCPFEEPPTGDISTLDSGFMLADDKAPNTGDLEKLKKQKEDLENLRKEKADLDIKIAVQKKEFGECKEKLRTKLCLLSADGSQNLCECRIPWKIVTSRTDLSFDDTQMYSKGMFLMPEESTYQNIEDAFHRGADLSLFAERQFAKEACDQAIKFWQDDCLAYAHKSGLKDPSSFKCIVNFQDKDPCSCSTAIYDPKAASEDKIKTAQKTLLCRQKWRVASSNPSQEDHIGASFSLVNYRLESERQLAEKKGCQALASPAKVKSPAVPSASMGKISKWQNDCIVAQNDKKSTDTSSSSEWTCAGKALHTYEQKADGILVPLTTKREESCTCDLDVPEFEKTIYRKIRSEYLALSQKSAPSAEEIARKQDLSFEWERIKSRYQIELRKERNFKQEQLLMREKALETLSQEAGPTIKSQADTLTQEREALLLEIKDLNQKIYEGFPMTPEKADKVLDTIAERYQLLP